MTSREKFEARAREQGYLNLQMTDGPGAMYRDGELRRDWSTWQAAARILNRIAMKRGRK